MPMSTARSSRGAARSWTAISPSIPSKQSGWQHGSGRTRRSARSIATSATSRCRHGSTSIGIAGALATSRKTHAWRGMAAAAALCLAVGLAGGWIGRGYRGATDAGQATLVNEAVAAHSLYAREVVHPVEVRADQQAHLTAWLSKRLDRNLVLPDLRPLGFGLVGGRLLPAQGQPAAQLMYEDATGQRVTFLIVAASNGHESSLQYGEEDGLRSLLWTDEAIRCVLVGSLSRDRLRDIATLAYEQLG